jgi:pSer/pThr/pTyr-binding forkhead associated (FHA) protein
MDPSWKRCPVCLAPLRGWLVQLGNNGINKQPEKVYTLHEGKSFIGSGAECEIRVLEGSLLRQHACFTLTEGRCSIVNMGSAPNTMQVNSREGGGVERLIDGDIIRLGNKTFQVKLLL